MIAERIETSELSPVPDSMKSEYERLRLLSDEQLQGELDATLEVTASHFRKLATVVRVMEERGHDLSGLRIPLIRELRLVSMGQLLPDALSSCGHMPGKLNAMKELPLNQQAKILREGIPVAVMKDGGRVEQAMIPLVEARLDQVRSAIADGRIRSVEEQARSLRFVRQRIEVEPEPLPYVIRGGRCIVNRPTTFTKRDIERILESMR